VLSGANFGPWVPPFPAYVPLPENQPGKGIGHFFGAMRIDAFRPAADFKKDMDLWIKRFRTTEPINKKQPIVIPGDPERNFQKERLANGIPIHQVVLEDLDQLASKLNIPKLFS
jgi:LDH2 family malate/lactate/ureidoglycolate dehydrogenase